jgi:hypothetical protein
LWLQQEDTSSSVVESKLIHDHVQGQLGKVQVHQFVLSQKVGSQLTRGLQRTTLLNTGVLKCEVMESSKRDKENLF